MAASWPPNALPNEGKSSHELMLKKSFFLPYFNTFQTFPKPPKTLPKTVPKSIFMQFVPIIFSFLFCIELLFIFYWFQSARNPKNRAPVQAGALFLQNRRFRFKSKNPSKNHRNSISKIKEKLKKIVKKRCLKTCWLWTSIFNDFGSILPPKLSPNFRIIFG